MNLGTENRKKTIAAGGLGMAAVVCVGYLVYSLFGFGDSPAPPPSIAPISRPATTPGINAPATSVTRSLADNNKTMLTPTGNTPGVARQVGTSSASLDPSLDETAMLRTEALVYSGSGRNIFSALYTPPPPPIPPAPKVRPCPPNCPPPIQQTKIEEIKPITCPPTCPPIALKFFGTETTASGNRMAFLLDGDDVFLASVGDIIARKYKIVSVNANSVAVEDLANRNTQTLPLQSN